MIKWSVIRGIKIYQKVLSPLVGPTCRFHPTCSTYMIDAIEMYGVFYGVWKGIKRIARCHPFSKGGVDFVGEKP